MSVDKLSVSGVQPQLVNWKPGIGFLTRILGVLCLGLVAGHERLRYETGHQEPRHWDSRGMKVAGHGLFLNVNVSNGKDNAWPDHTFIQSIVSGRPST